MKTFEEFLNKQNEDDIIYVGTKNDSGWIVIETAKDLINNMNKVEKLVHRRVKETNKRSKEKLIKIPGLIVDSYKRIEELDPKSDDYNKTVKQINNSIRRLESEFASAYTIRNKTNKTLEHWIHMKDRPVIETYEHETDIKGICCLLKGDENGTLWFKGEYKTI